MKASVKFREDRAPLLRAKVPISVLGLPVVSGVTAGDRNELCLSLRTFFESGPSGKISYRPNNSWNPFSFAVKTGTGVFGSPISAPMTISTEFSLLGRGGPAFFLRFKPELGDFSINKSVGSTFSLPLDSPVFDRKTRLFEKRLHAELANPPDGIEAQVIDERTSGFQSSAYGAGGMEDFFTDLEVSARSILPLSNRLQMKFRWSIKLPREIRRLLPDGRGRGPVVLSSLKKNPLLAINKISLEHVAGDDGIKSAEATSLLDLDAAHMFMTISKQLGFLQAENETMKKCIGELRSELSRSRSASTDGHQESERRRTIEKLSIKPTAGDDRKDRQIGATTPESGAIIEKPTSEPELNEQVKNALLTATGSGV